MAGPDARRVSVVDLGTEGLERGGHLLLKRALRALAPGERLAVHSEHPVLRPHLQGWCRARAGGRGGGRSASSSKVSLSRS